MWGKKKSVVRRNGNWWTIKLWINSDGGRGGGGKLKSLWENTAQNQGYEVTKPKIKVIKSRLWGKMVFMKDKIKHWINFKGKWIASRKAYSSIIIQFLFKWNPSLFSFDRNNFVLKTRFSHFSVTCPFWGFLQAMVLILIVRISRGGRWRYYFLSYKMYNISTICMLGRQKAVQRVVRQMLGELI